MLTINECIQEHSPIINLSSFDDSRVAYITSHGIVKVINPKEHSTIIKIFHKNINNTTTATAFSPNGKLLAFANKNIIHILDLRTKTLIKSIKTLTQNIEILTFSSNSTYIIAGTHNGRVLQYRYNHCALLSRLCSFPYKQTTNKKNFVSAFAVFENKLACSGLGGAIYAFDIYAQTNKLILKEKGERVDALCFIDNNRLISGNIKGDILVHYLDNSEKTKKIDAPFTKIKSIIKMPNPNYILIVGNSNYLAIADIKRNKILHSKYVEFDTKVKHALIIDKDSLLVTLDNNKILNIELATPILLESFILHNSLDKAFELIEDEPMLKDTKEYKLLQKRYDTIYRESINSLINQNKTLALKTIQMLKDVKSKKNEIQALFKAFEKYNRFKVLYLEKKYALAYAMSQKYEALKQTPIYAKLENKWLNSFINAKRHLLLGNYEAVKTLMNEYITVMSKRPIIKLFLNKDNDFIRFLKAMDNNDSQTIKKLIEKNTIFMQIPTFVSNNQTMKDEIQKVELLINQGEICKAKEILSKLKNNYYLEEKLNILYSKLQNMQKLKKAYDENNFKSCYEILDTHHHLNLSELGILLNKHWEKLIHECENFALKGNAKGIKNKLDELISVSTRANKIGDLLRVSFHSKIKAFLVKNMFNNAENLIYSYVDIFGSDNEIKSLMKTFENISKRKLAITQNQNERFQRNKWIKSELFMMD